MLFPGAAERAGNPGVWLGVDCEMRHIGVSGLKAVFSLLIKLLSLKPGALRPMNPRGKPGSPMNVPFDAMSRRFSSHVCACEFPTREMTAM